MRRNLSSMFALVIGVLAVHPLAADEVGTTAAGSITINGQPLPLGKITFYLDDDQFVGSKIKNGSYKVTRIPAGEWRVAIEGGGAPASFGSEETTPLRVVVKQGPNTVNFDLTR
jgi:hypothetical protein